MELLLSITEPLQKNPDPLRKLLALVSLGSNPSFHLLRAVAPSVSLAKDSLRVSLCPWAQHDIRLSSTHPRHCSADSEVQYEYLALQGTR